MEDRLAVSGAASATLALERTRAEIARARFAEQSAEAQQAWNDVRTGLRFLLEVVRCRLCGALMF